MAIGRAMAAHPGILFLDEPLSALDEDTYAGMIELLCRVHRHTGVSVLHITHNRREARALAQSLIVLRDGEFIEGEEAVECSAPGADDL